MSIDEVFLCALLIIAAWDIMRRWIERRRRWI